MNEWILLFTDVHTHDWREFSQDGSRLDLCLSVWDSIGAFCVREGIDYAAFLGDLFHQRSFIDTVVFNCTGEKVEEFCRYVRLLLLPGNHDIATRSGYHALRGFWNVKNCTVPKRLEPLDFAVKGRRIILLPYNEDVEQYREYLKASRQQGTVLLTHAAVQGAKTGAGEYVPKHPLSLQEFQGYVMAMSGHYHAEQGLVWKGKTVGPSDLRYQNPLFLYIGSTMEHRMGEMPSRHGFVLFNVRTLEVRRFSLAYPRFKRVKWTDHMKLQKIKGNYVVAEYRNDGERKGFDRLLPHAAAFKIQYVAEDAVTEERVDMNPDMGNEELAKRYVRYHKTDIPEPVLVKTGMEILEEAI